MSLEAIRHMRLRGDRPGIVRLVVGVSPAWLPDDATVVKVPEGSRPARMDWRPLVGLPVTLIETRSLPQLVGDVMDEVTRAGAKFCGAALMTGVYPCLDGYETEVRRNLKKTWEILCT
jgi:hypothetical protein